MQTLHSPTIMTKGGRGIPTATRNTRANISKVLGFCFDFRSPDRPDLPMVSLSRPKPRSSVLFIFTFRQVQKDFLQALVQLLDGFIKLLQSFSQFLSEIGRAHV